MTMDRRQLAKALSATIATAGLLQAAPAETAIASAADAELSLSLPTLVHPGIWTTTVGKPEQHTPVSLRLVQASLQSLGRMPAADTVPISDLRGTITARGCVLSLPLEPGEKIYGFGLQLLSSESRGKKRIIRVNADPKGDSGDSHAPVPFYVTSRGYGIFIDTLRQVEFYCGEAHPKPTQAASPQVVAANAPEDTDLRAQASSSRMVIEVPRAAGVDVYLFAGPSMLEVVRRYNLFSGGGVAPPEWGLGFWYRVELHSDHESALTLAREFRERKIPCDVLGLEPGWQTHAYSCSYVWNSQRFPDPPAFLRESAAIGFKINLWEHAFIHPSSPVFEALVPHAGDYAVWEGLVPDFAGDPARKIFGDYHGRQMIDVGVSGFKLDECDGSDYTGGWSFPDMARFPSGLDGEQMHAVFGLRYQHAIWQQFLDRRQPTYNLVRSSGALASPYPFVLYSDLYDHRQFVRGVVTAGFSGLLWCPEVRDASSEEDLIRRLESVVFSPLAMVNAWYIKNPPWKQIDRTLNNQGQVSENWQALETRCREIIGWRMQLVPYLRSAFARYALDGTPPFRAMILDYPGEARFDQIDDQYMVGDRMLVAPLFAGEPGRAVLLPPGEWYDFWTRQPVSGSSLKVTASASTKIPVFIKAGCVLPLAAIGASSESPESRQLTVAIFGDGHLPFQIESERGVELELRWDAASRAGHLQQNPVGRPYQVSAWQQSL